jgi:uncharacterized protein YegP (UPF0339 family)
MTERGVRQPKVEFYRNRKGEWSWRVRAKNGAVICTPGEGYMRRGGAISAFRRVAKLLEAGVYDIAVVQKNKGSK